MNISLFFILVLALVTSKVESANALYVSNSGSNDTSCLNGSQSCANLTLVLDHIRHQNDIEVYIEPGHYDLSPNISLTFEQVQNVYIARNGTKGMVDISCQGTTSGLSFSNCTNVTITGLSFTGCGMEHNSTSLDFPSHDTFLTFFASLYFEGCSNITLDSISVSDSLGIAVQFYYTPNVTITNSNFANNNLDMYKISGGVYIEFPYCVPNGEICSGTNVPTEYVTHSQYVISGCNFTNNIARNALDDSRRYVLPNRFYHVAFGQGGGLSVFFKGNASDCTVIVEDCTFTNNKAEYGGGAYFDMQDNSYNNHVIMRGVNTIISNHAKNSGGGAYASFIFADEVSTINDCSFSIMNTIFHSNNATYGGGLYYITTRQKYKHPLLPNSMKLSQCNWIENKAQSGAGFYLLAFRGIGSGIIEVVNITNSSFEGNYVRGLHKYSGKQLGYGALYTDQVSVTFFTSASFQNNKGTALLAIHAIISVAENTSVIFCNNTGVNGGAVTFFSSSVMKISERTSMHFINNSALNLGGAIYVESIVQQDIPNSCFLQYYNYVTPPADWNTKFIFSGNKANNKTNSIYSSSIASCVLGRGFGIPDSDINNTFCWNNGTAIWKYNDSECMNACVNHIETAAKNLNSPYKNTNPFQVIPGKMKFMGITAFDDQKDNVTSNLILHATTHSPGVIIDNTTDYISNNEIILYQHSTETDFTIILDTITSESLLEIELFIRFSECPPGLTLNDHGKCQCDGSFASRVDCHNANFDSFLLRGYWIGKYNDKTVVGHCRNCEYKNKTGRLNLSDGYERLDDLLCGDHSKGVLCSKCEEGYHPAINSDEFHCVDCNFTDTFKGIAVFLSLDILLPLVLLVLIFFSDVPLTSGLLHGPILFGQMVTTVISLDGDDVITYESIFNGTEAAEKVYVAFYDIFNSEFLMSLQNYCLSQSLPYAGIIALQYLTAILPLGFVVFVAIIYYCEEHKWRTCLNIRKPKCMRKSRWATRFKNSPNALATFILLSYTKIAVITGYLLTPVNLIAATDTTSNYDNQVMYLDGTIEYGFHNRGYLVYFLFAFIVGMPFLIVIPLFLFFFRSNDPGQNGGFLNHLLHQFQQEFCDSDKDFNMTVSNAGKRSSVFSEKSVEHRARLNYECKFCAINECCSCKLLATKCWRVPLYMKWSRYDFRWLAGGLFILRLCLILPYMVAYSIIIQYILQFTVCMIGGVAIITIRPYKRDKERSDLYKYVDANAVEAGSLLLLALLIALSMYQYTYTVADIPLSKWAYVLQFLLVWVPFVWFVIAYLFLFAERYDLRCKIFKKFTEKFKHKKVKEDARPMVQPLLVNEVDVN